MSEPSLFLAHVPENVKIVDISDAFHAREIGMVSRIEWIPNKKQDGTAFKTCFVFFLAWYDTPASRKMRAGVAAEDAAKFYFGGRRAPAPYWKVAVNTSATAAYPPNAHVDLEVLVDAHVMEESVADAVEILNLGKVLKISSGDKPGAANLREDLLCRDSRDPREMKLPYPHDTIIYRVQFEYWHRNLAAAQFQHRMFDAAAQLEAELAARSCGQFWQPPSEAARKFVCVQASDCMMLKFYAAEATNEGGNPFVWINPALPALPRAAYTGPAATAAPKIPADPQGRADLEAGPGGSGAAPTIRRAEPGGARQQTFLGAVLGNSPLAQGVVDIAAYMAAYLAVPENRALYDFDEAPSPAWVACSIRNQRAHPWRARDAHEDDCESELDLASDAAKIAFMFKYRPLKYHEGFVRRHGLGHVHGPEPEDRRPCDRTLNCRPDLFSAAEIQDALERHSDQVAEDAHMEERYSRAGDSSAAMKAAKKAR